MPYPIIPGPRLGRHASPRPTGRSSASTASRLREGDPVVFFDVHRTCGRCYACTVARTPTRCPSRRVYGITDPAAEGLLGGWAQAIYLEPGVAVAKLPDGVSPEAYIGGGCGLLTAVHAIERAGVRSGIARARPGRRRGRAEHRRAGPHRRRRTGSARSAIPADRRALATAMGADAVYALTELRRGPAARRSCAATDGRGPDIVIEAAGSARAVEEGLEMVRDGGVYVIAGHYTDVGASTISAHRHINRKHLDLRGCWGSEVRHFATALDLLAAARGDGALGAHRRDDVRPGRAERGAAAGRGAGLHQGAGGAERDAPRAGLTRLAAEGVR